MRKERKKVGIQRIFFLFFFFYIYSLSCTRVYLKVVWVLPRNMFLIWFGGNPSPKNIKGHHQLIPQLKNSFSSATRPKTIKQSNKNVIFHASSIVLILIIVSFEVSSSRFHLSNNAQTKSVNNEPKIKLHFKIKMINPGFCSFGQYMEILQ